MKNNIKHINDFICKNIMARGINLLKITKVYKWSRKNIITIVAIVWFVHEEGSKKIFL